MVARASWRVRRPSGARQSVATTLLRRWVRPMSPIASVVAMPPLLRVDRTFPSESASHAGHSDYRRAGALLMAGGGRFEPR